MWVGCDIAPSMLEVAAERGIEGDLMQHDMGRFFDEEEEGGSRRRRGRERERRERARSPVLSEVMLTWPSRYRP